MLPLCSLYFLCGLSGLLLWTLRRLHLRFLLGQYFQFDLLPVILWLLLRPCLLLVLGFP